MKQRDRGSATLYAIWIGLAVVAAGLGAAYSASFLIARAEARTAADLGALAGAAWAGGGEQVACARAAVFATDNGASVVSCTLDGLDLWLTVEVRGARAVARAGPVSVGTADAKLAKVGVAHAGR